MSNEKKRFNFSGDVKSYLKEHQYKDNGPDFEKLWDQYRDFAEKMDRKKIIRPFFLNFRFQAVSVLSLIVLITAVFFFNRISFIQDAGKGRFFIVSLNSGNAVLERKGSKSLQKLDIKQPLRAGDTLKVNDKSFCEIQIMKMTYARIENDSEVSFNNITDTRGKFNARLTLSKGRIFIKQHSLKEGESFRVETPSAVVSVVGTKFMVNTDADGNTEAAVGEGRVRITLTAVKSGGAGSGFELSAGESAVIYNTGKTRNELYTKGKIPAEIKNKLDGIAGDAVIRDLGNSSVLNIGSAPSGADVFINGSFSGHTPLRFLHSRGGRLDIKITKSGFEDFITNNFSLDRNGEIKAGLKEAVLNNLPGTLAWDKDVRLETLEKEAAFYAGKIYVSDGNMLKIISSEGVLLKSVQTVPENSALTRPVIDQGRVYVGSDKGGIYAYSPDGSPLWSDSSAGREKYYASPAAAYGIVAVPSLDKGIMVYDNAGKLLDAVVLKKGESVYSTPLLIQEGSVMVYATEKGDIAAYSLKDKKEIWKISPVNDRIVFPLLGGDSAVIIFYRAAGTILCVDPRDGGILWRKEIKELSRTEFSPVYLKGKAVFASDTPSGAYISIIDALSGKKEVPVRLKGSLSSLAFYDKELYISLKNGDIHAFDFNKGRQVWVYKSGLESSFMIAGGNGVYTLSSGKMLKINK